MDAAGRRMTYFVDDARPPVRGGIGHRREVYPRVGRGGRPCWPRRHVGRDGDGALPARGVSPAGDHPASREVNPRPGYAARQRTLPARRRAQPWCRWEPWSSPGGSSAPPPAPSSRGSSSAASSMPSWSVSGSFGSVPRATSSPSERPSPSVSGLSGSVPSFCSARSESPSPSRSTRGGRAAASGPKPTPHSRTDALSSPAAIVLVLLVFIPRLLSFEEFVHPLRVRAGGVLRDSFRSEEHTSELQSQSNLVCRLLLEK